MIKQSAKSYMFLLILLVSGVFAAACTPVPSALDSAAPVSSDVPEKREVPPETAQKTPAPAAPAETAPAVADDEVPVTEAAPSPAVQREQIGEDEARQLMSALLFRAEEAPAALERILEAEDARFTAVLIELLRGQQIGVVRSGLSAAHYQDAIEQLNGEFPGEDWFEIIEWYGQTDLEPPPGFTRWKGQMLSLIDPRFATFLNDTYPSTIRVEEIQWGGVPVDGIPALDQPRMVKAGEADYLDADNVVFGIELNGQARAYPKRILDWHEMANDVIGGVPVSLAYCTLCGAAVAFDGRAPDGNTYDFGSSGFLFRSNKLMYDRQTNTLWNQLTGEPVMGELVDSGIQLDVLPVVLTTWEAWLAQHPDTLVVDIDTGYNRDYRPGAAYGDYFAYEDTMFPVWQRSDLLQAKDQIYALRINEVPKAYPIETLAAEQVVNDELGGEEIVLVAPGEIIQIEGDSLRSGQVTYDAGSAVRAYARGDHRFVLGADQRTLRDEAGNSWQITERALLGPDGAELARFGGHLAYWFGWFAFFPNTSIYGQ